MMAGYTRMVSWVGRTATLFLVILLAGGPAAATACETDCAEPPATAESTQMPGVHNSGHHHHAAETRTAAAEAVAMHRHQPLDRDAAAISHDSDRTRLRGHDCCEQLAAARPSLMALRGDTGLQPGSQAAVLSSGATVTNRAAQGVGPSHRPPPGEMSPVRTPLVLRI